MTLVCQVCNAALELPCACSACGALQPDHNLPGSDPADPWATLGLARSMAIDATSLKKRLLQGSRMVHPDFHGADPASRALAELHSARLNRAYETLADEARRADALVLLLGGPSDTVAREMPREFLVEVLEWNEALEDARASKTWSPAVVRLRDELHARRQAELAGVHSLLSNPLDSSPTQLAQARARLNAVRYLDRSLTDIEALRLACAS